MNKQILSVLAVIIVLLFGGIFGLNVFDNNTAADVSTNTSQNISVQEDGEYITVEEVSAYIKEFHKLPKNYITKKEAQNLGWQGGPLKKYAPGKSIGGDVFTNRQGILPHIESKYIECDIDANGTSRGAKRIVYSTEDYKVYYTDDHYATFKEV
ncbi:MAG: ribonuclease [Methanosphaera stadtmanae]|jgi:guanyl-specific ribonuclease Sa|nr:ribonuclease [Methanosphaera stadtmanae]